MQIRRWLAVSIAALAASAHADSDPSASRATAPVVTLPTNPAASDLPIMPAPEAQPALPPAPRARFRNEDGTPAEGAMPSAMGLDIPTPAPADNYRSPVVAMPPPAPLTGAPPPAEPPPTASTMPAPALPNPPVARRAPAPVGAAPAAVLPPPPPGGYKAPTVALPPPPSLQGAPTQQSPGERGEADDPLFPHLPILKRPVAFWTQVFADWSENQTAFHSMENLGKVYTVLDFRREAAELSPVELAVLRSRRERETFAEINESLKSLQALLDRDGSIDPQTLSAAQRRLFDLYADSRDPQRFKDALGSFRMQRGLRERTQHALETSGRYLPEMERIFSSYGLPVRLTRLPLVESSFNVDAYSKAAAAGLWQFIPASARIYMRLNEVADDRRDPWTSTDAAARHLKDDHDVLGDWPLALTAYNFGRGGLARALQQVNGTTLTDVIERFEGHRFGFASSNFYAEFLAASDVERDWRKHYEQINREAPLAFELVKLADYVPYETLRRLAGADSEQFRSLNPAYRDEVVEGRLYVPAGDSIRVPAGSAERFRLAYATLSPGQRFDRQRQYYLTHLVARGESLGKLAKLYGVSTREILAANGLSDARRIRVGRTIKIPPRSAPATELARTSEPARSGAATVAVAETTVAEPVRVSHRKATVVRTHKVRAGQTLGLLAHRYQTTIESLRALNGLGKGEVLRVGSVLKIPNG